MPIYSYRCPTCDTVETDLRSVADRDSVYVCDRCNTTCNRAVDAPAIKLEGITGHFPGAASKWERDHYKAAKRKSQED